MNTGIAVARSAAEAGGRIAWADVITRAAEIVRAYDTPVTLRQLFYRLVAALLIPNSQTAYKRLSDLTAQARRAGTFPALIDRGREVQRPLTFDSPQEARGWLASVYRRDRTEGQPVSLYLGVEKAGLVHQLNAWFRALGVPILPLGGYASQTFVDEVRQDVRAQARPALLIYAGDFDPSGIDIERDFVERAACFDEVARVALTAEQISMYDLPPLPGKATDSRAASFVALHGRLVQVELDALPPDVLHALFQEAIEASWDTSAYGRALARERRERDRLW